MGKRVLVTGSEGFTGRYIYAELQSAGYQVYGVGIQPAAAPNYHQADLQNIDQLCQVVAAIQPDVVIHLAALAFVGHGDANAFYQVNLLGTRNLLEAIAASGKTPDCVLLASSANIYGNQAEGLLTEETLPAPANDYAVSKLAMEYMARLWMDRLPIVITRPFNYTGVGQSPNFLLPKIVGHFQRGERVIELGNIDVERDFSDVRMVAQAYCRLLQLAPAGETFNVCSGMAWSLKDALAMMAEIAGYEIEVRVNPAFVRANEVKRLQGNCGKLLGVVGALDEIPLRETLRWMYAKA